MEKSQRKPQTRKRAIVFIDGNNFYHGMRTLNLTPGVEFDYEAFSEKLVGAREWVETRYYTGRVRQVGNLTHYQKQRIFLAHLAQCRQIKVRLGRLEMQPADKRAGKKLRKWLKALPHRDDVNLPPGVFDELTEVAQSMATPIWVEKAVDVMIATDMISMAYEDKYDVAYLVSADGDFTPVVEKIRHTGRQVFAASPSYGHELAGVVDTFIRTKRDFYHDCWL